MQSEFMACGHSSNGAILSNGDPVCAACIGIFEGAKVVATEPDLTGRSAKCAYFKNHKSRFGGEVKAPIQPSSFDLPFFEYRGPGSPFAERYCQCGYSDRAHNNPNNRVECDNFVPRGPYEYDDFYCGCRGWD